MNDIKISEVRARGASATSGTALIWRITQSGLRS
jgi:hypothetical protein